MKNELARDLSLAEGKHQYDNQVKRVLSNKIILAWIYYDIRFSAYLETRKERIRLLINVEAQKAFYPGYSLTTRGIFYGARMISAQKGTEFAGRDYDNIRKVYSIWICMNAPDYIGNAISKYRICKEDLIPGIPDQRNTYDKMTVVTVCLNPKSGKGNPLTRMLGLLLSPKIKGKVKIQQLKEEFAIPMESKSMGEELNQMCNLSDYVEELGIQKGLERGLEQGLERGLEQGLEQGKERLLRLQIEKKLAKGLSLPEIADALEEKEETIRKMIGAIKHTTE